MTFDLANVDLTTEWRDLEVRFHTGPTESEAAARFEFNFGNERPNVVRFDDVRVVESPG